jgi:hypothetical protein
VCPQRGGGTEPGLLGDLVDGEVRRLEQVLGVAHPLLDQPGARRLAGLLAEAAGEGAQAHAGVTSQRWDVRRQVLDRPGARSRGGLADGRRHVTLDVLCLAAVAPGRYDAVSGDRVGDLAAVVATEQVQAEVDAGAEAGAGEHVALVGEEHARVDAHTGVEGAQLVGVLPVRRGGPAVEQAGGREHEGTGTDRHQPGVRPDRRQRRTEVGRKRAVRAWARHLGARHDHGVGRGQGGCVVLRGDRVARRRADGSAVEARHRHVVEPSSVGVLGLAEELGRDHRVVADQRLEEQDDDAVRTGHGRILAHIGDSATGRR